MAAADYPGGLRPHPPGLRPGPRPSSEMPGQGDAGGLQGRPLLAGRVTGTAEPPPRSRAPPASQAMTLKRHPRPGRGTRGQSRGLPDEEMPAPSQEARVTTRSDQADIRTAQLDRCSIKQETEIGKSQDLRCALPGVSWAQAPNPDNRIWGESSLHQTRGVPDFPGAFGHRESEGAGLAAGQADVRGDGVAGAGDGDVGEQQPGDALAFSHRGGGVVPDRGQVGDCLRSLEMTM